MKGVDYSMSTAVVEALERNAKPKQLRKRGFLPATIYGDGIKTIAVQFNMQEMIKIMKNTLRTSTLNVKIGEKVKSCLVKDVQRDSATGEIIHLDMQAVRENEEVKLKVPITFTGKSMLENKNLLLQILLPEIELSSSAKELPDSIEIDLENKEFGDKIMASDIELNESVTMLTDKDEVIAVISALK